MFTLEMTAGVASLPLPVPAPCRALERAVYTHSFAEADFNLPARKNLLILPYSDELCVLASFFNFAERALTSVKVK